MDDWEGWQDMPIIRGDTSRANYDEEDAHRFGYKATTYLDADQNPIASTSKLQSAAPHNLPAKDNSRKLMDNYTRLELDDDVEGDQVHLRTDYLFDDDKDMTPLSQMQATKNLLTEGQRIAYVGLCKLVARQMVHHLESGRFKELQPAVQSAQNWANKIIGRLYLHMDVNASEQKMFDQLSEHGVDPDDLVPSLVTTHVVPNPQYDPNAEILGDSDDEDDDSASVGSSGTGKRSIQASLRPAFQDEEKEDRPDIREAEETREKKSSNLIIEPLPSALPGVSTHLTAADKTLILDIRWTVLCDLFLALIADSVYDSRSRVLLGAVAERMGLSWLDVVRFERRLTDALQIQEGVSEQENQAIMEERSRSGKRRRWAMMAAAGLGGGLVIGLSAGLLAPVIGAGIGATLGLVGVSGTTTFLAGAGGAAIITTGGVLSGTTIASRGMQRRTASVKTFDFLPLHNNKRVACYVTVPGFMSGIQDDVRLPFSVLDPLIGDVFSVLWEPETILQTGDALKILTSEILTQAGQQILAATVMTALMSAVQLPVMLTKLAYLIDNPWSNALDRAKQAGQVLADVLIRRNLGVRPVSLIGFSLGARVIFYALAELARTKNFGIVQDAFMLGACVTASKKQWKEVKGTVAGRFVNGYATNDWILGYLFRASTGGIQTVAGLRPVEGIPDLENIDLTDIVVGHMSYRSKMPLILARMGFVTTSDRFDEPEEDDALRPDREVLTKEEEEHRRIARETRKKKRSFWKWRKEQKSQSSDSKGGSQQIVEDEPEPPNPQSSVSEHYDYEPPLFDTYEIRREIAAINEENSNDSANLTGSTLHSAGIAVRGERLNSDSQSATVYDSAMDKPTIEVVGRENTPLQRYAGLQQVPAELGDVRTPSEFIKADPTENDSDLNEKATDADDQDSHYHAHPLPETEGWTRTAMDSSPSSQLDEEVESKNERSISEWTSDEGQGYSSVALPTLQDNLDESAPGESSSRGTEAKWESNPWS